MVAGSSEFVVSRREWGRRCCEQKGETGQSVCFGTHPSFKRYLLCFYCVGFVWSQVFEYFIENDCTKALPAWRGSTFRLLPRRVEKVLVCLEIKGRHIPAAKCEGL